MNLVIELSRQLDDAKLSNDEQAELRCQMAHELETAGDYEAARLAMSGLWHRVGERPQLTGLEARVAAEVLLRAGSLSGWIGSARQIDAAQETAKDLLSESASAFAALGMPNKVAEANIALAVCYWREGSFDEARVTLQEVLARLGDDQSELRARALLNWAMVEGAAMRLSDALHILIGAAPLFDGSDNHALRGSFHSVLASVLKTLGAAEGLADYTDRALIEYAAASYHFEEAKHVRNCARVENNLGFLFLQCGKIDKAHEHLDRARSIFAALKENGSVAQVDETRARVFLAENNAEEAERLSRTSVRTLETGGEQAILSEALNTRGMALARLGRFDEARETFERAIETAEQSSNNESAGLAALTYLEELSGEFTTQERFALYERADRMLGDTAPREILERLRSCARRSFTAQLSPVEEIQSPTFVYAAPDTAAFLRIAHRIADSHEPVLVSGEAGTGKRVLAKLIHEWSGRAGEFVVLDCAANPAIDIVAHLFDNLNEAFTNSQNAEIGAIRNAPGGTLLINEITVLNLADQLKLMRVIESEETPSIRASEPNRSDVRIIATTSHNIRREVELGNFRDDLFYRLEAFNLVIPPLRERTADIAAIAHHFLIQESAASGRQLSLTPDAIEALSRLPLEGNANELRSLIQQMVATSPNEKTLTAQTVETSLQAKKSQAGVTEPWPGCSLEQEVLQFEGGLIKRALETAGGSVTRAARLLDITHQGLAFILQGRHQSLLPSRTPARPRRRSLMRPVERSSKTKNQ
jgi:DNA-binding NtrC family response regulator/Tfp pilus assembly protein PilF